MAITVSKDIQVLKQNTDGRNTGLVYRDAFATTGNATPLTVMSIPVPILSGIILKASVLGVRPDGTEGIGSEIISRARRASAGNVTLIGANTAVGTAEDSSGTPTVVINANTSTQALDIVVTGEAAKEFHWTVRVEYVLSTSTGAVVV
jgi:hypothetical protein